MASLMKNLAPDYNSSTSYVAGDRVLYNKNLYNCTKATTGSFDADCWTEIFLSDLIKGGLNSNLGGKLLWTNPSPTSNFSAQTVSLDLSNYQAAIIEYNVNTSGLTVFATRCMVMKSDSLQYFSPGMVIDGSNDYDRGITSFTDTGITFANAYNTQTASVNAKFVANNVLIPYKIYGVNLNLPS